LTKVSVEIKTADEPGAATGGSVYLGLGGREFRCNTDRDDFAQGATDTFVFGAGANVKHPAINDPRTPEMTLTTVDRFPVYLRFDQGVRAAWKLAHVTVRLTAAGLLQPLFFSSHMHPGGVRLGTESGAYLFLARTNQESELAPT
jgi:hypothetical protein